MHLTRLGIAFVTLLAASVRTSPLLGAERDGENAAVHYRQAFAALPDTSDPQWDFLKDPDRVALNDDASSFLRTHDSTFEHLRKGAAAKRCDWGTDVRAGPGAMLPHLNYARTVANLARLRVRWLSRQGRHVDALEDVAALLTLSRHIGSEPFIISKLIEAGVADSAVHAAEQALADAPVDDARKLAASIDAMPHSMHPALVVTKEGESIANHLRRLAKQDPGPLFADGGFFHVATSGRSGGAAVREQVRRQWADVAAREAAAKEVAALFEEVAQHLALPFEQSFAVVQKWEKKRESASPLARVLVPSMRTYRTAVASAETRVEMMRVASLVRAHGPDAAADSTELHASGPFTCREIPGGFQLESKLVFEDQPLRFTCRKGSDALPF